MRNEETTAEHHLLKLRGLLGEVQNAADSSFVGAGVIVYSTLESISHFTMGPDIVVPTELDIAKEIIQTSSRAHLHHDGFHFIDSLWRLTHGNQYVAPQIPENFRFPADNSFGGARFATAILISMSNSVICSGVVSVDHGVTLFCGGRTQ